MESLFEKLENAKYKFENINQIYKNVLYECLNEKTQYSFSETLDSRYRFAFSMFIGVFQPKYAYSYDKYRLEKHFDWKSKEYLNTFLIIKTEHQHLHQPIGWICEKKDLKFALVNEFKNLWLFYISENRNYTKSLSEFEKDCKKEIDLLNLFRDFISKKNIGNIGTIEIINVPKLKIKNVLIYITN
jgi:hypothetical protein